MAELNASRSSASRAERRRLVDDYIAGAADRRLLVANYLLDQLHQAQTQIDRQARTIARLEAGEHRFLCVGCGVAVWSRAQEPPPSWRPDPAQPERFRCQDCAARAAAASPATMGMQTPMPPLGYEG